MGQASGYTEKCLRASFVEQPSEGGEKADSMFISLSVQCKLDICNVIRVLSVLTALIHLAHVYLH